MQHVTAKLRQNGTLWKYLLLGLFLFAQSFAASHEVVHLTQDVQDETCILCHSNDNTPTDTGAPQSDDHVPESKTLRQLSDYGITASNAPYTLNARAPPSA